MPPQVKIFVSYAEEDQLLSTSLMNQLSDLSELHHYIEVDFQSFPPKPDLVARTMASNLETLRESDVTVLILSSAYLKSLFYLAYLKPLLTQPLSSKVIVLLTGDCAWEEEPIYGPGVETFYADDSEERNGEALLTQLALICWKKYRAQRLQTGQQPVIKKVASGQIPRNRASVFALLAVFVFIAGITGLFYLDHKDKIDKRNAVLESGLGDLSQEKPDTLHSQAVRHLEEPEEKTGVRPEKSFEAYNKYFSVGEDRMAAHHPGKSGWGLTDTLGTPVTEFIYRRIATDGFKEGVIRVKWKSRYIFIDKNGKRVREH